MMIRTLFSVFCALGMFMPQAHAQFLVQQAKVSLSVSGGEHLNGSILVNNTSNQPEDIRAYWEDFQYKAPWDGTKKFLPQGTSPDSASRWVTFSPQAFTIPPYGQQSIQYTVAAPANVDRGHYGVLFFEKTAAGNINGDNVNLVTRIGSLFFIEPANKSKKADLDNIAVKGNGITADFVNQGNVVLIPHTTYYVMQQGGTVLSRGELKKLYVPPGVSAPLSITFDKPLAPGPYTLVINSDLEEGDVVVKEVGLSADSAGQFTLVNSRD